MCHLFHHCQGNVQLFIVHTTYRANTNAEFCARQHILGTVGEIKSGNQPGPTLACCEVTSH